MLTTYFKFIGLRYTLAVLSIQNRCYVLQSDDKLTPSSRREILTLQLGLGTGVCNELCPVAWGVGTLPPGRRIGISPTPGITDTPPRGGIRGSPRIPVISIVSTPWEGGVGNPNGSPLRLGGDLSLLEKSGLGLRGVSNGLLGRLDEDGSTGKNVTGSVKKSRGISSIGGTSPGILLPRGGGCPRGKLSRLLSRDGLLSGRDGWPRGNSLRLMSGEGWPRGNSLRLISGRDDRSTEKRVLSLPELGRVGRSIPRTDGPRARELDLDLNVLHDDLKG